MTQLTADLLDLLTEDELYQALKQAKAYVQLIIKARERRTIAYKRKLADKQARLERAQRRDARNARKANKLNSTTTK